MRYGITLNVKSVILELLKGVGAKFVSESSIVLAAALDSIAGLGVTRKDDDPFTVGTVGLFHCSREKLGSLLPQPKGNASSKWIVEDIARPGIHCPT